MTLRTALKLGLIGAGAYGTKKLYDTVVANEIAKQVAMQTGSNPVAETKQQVKQLKAATKQKMKELHSDLSGPVGLTKDNLMRYDPELANLRSQLLAAKQALKAQKSSLVGTKRMQDRNYYTKAGIAAGIGGLGTWLLLRKFSKGAKPTNDKTTGFFAKLFKKGK